MAYCLERVLLNLLFYRTRSTVSYRSSEKGLLSFFKGKRPCTYSPRWTGMQEITVPSFLWGFCTSRGKQKKHQKYAVLFFGLSIVNLFLDIYEGFIFWFMIGGLWMGYHVSWCVYDALRFRTLHSFCTISFVRVRAWALVADDRRFWCCDGG